LLVNAKVRKTPSEYDEFDRKLTAAPPLWDTIQSPDVDRALNTEEGTRAVIRFLCDIGEKSMPDTELDNMLVDKMKDPTSDFSVAWKLVKESANPKANAV